MNLALETFQEKDLTRINSRFEGFKRGEGQAVCEDQSPPKKCLTTLFTTPLFTIQDFNDKQYYNLSFGKVCQQCTSKNKIAHENRPSQKESSLPSINFQVLLLLVLGLTTSSRQGLQNISTEQSTFQGLGRFLQTAAQTCKVW